MINTLSEDFYFFKIKLRKNMNYLGVTVNSLPLFHASKICSID